MPTAPVGSEHHMGCSMIARTYIRTAQKSRNMHVDCRFPLDVRGEMWSRRRKRPDLGRLGPPPNLRDAYRLKNDASKDAW